MAIFNFGKSKQSSQSSSYGYTQSFSDSLSQATSSSNQRIAFEELFGQLFGNATGAAERAAELVPALQGQAASLFSSGSQFLQSLQGPSPIADRLADTGTADAQIAALGDDLGAFLREDLLPQIASRGVATGTLGGGRQGVAQGRAAEAVAQQFQQGALNIRTADVARRDQLAGALAQDRLGTAQTGLASLPGLYELAQGGMEAEFAPLSMLAQILGDPTVLGSSSSEQIATALSRAIGEDFSQSTSKGKSFDFGLGFGK